MGPSRASAVARRDANRLYLTKRLLLTSGRIDIAKQNAVDFLNIVSCFFSKTHTYRKIRCFFVKARVGFSSKYTRCSKKVLVLYVIVRYS
jgi:hypothetical protein